MSGDQKRVLFNGKTILFLLILIGLSVWQYQNTYISQNDGAQARHGFYQEYIRQLAPLTKEDRTAQLETLGTELEESIATGMAQETIDDQMMSELFLRQSALAMVQEQNDYVDGYQAYLDKVQSDASYIQKGGIFGSADGYLAKNAAKTASDYEKMNAVSDRICLEPVYSFETIVKGDLTGLLAALFTLYLSVCLVRFQKRGLWDMVYATQKGRTRFFLGQIVVLLLGSVGSVCVLYGARVAEGILLFGESSSWNLPVQCSSLFESYTLSVSMWQMIALIFVFHIAAAFASALASWFFCILIRQEKIAVLVCLGIAVVESILYRSIAASSNLILLRVLNLAALWNIQEMMCGYQNVPIGTIPVGQYAIYIVYIGVLIFVCAGAGILFGSRRYPKGAASLSERFMELIGKAASRFAGVFPHENKTKMARILAASPKGRRVLNRRKCRMARWTVVFLWLTGSIMQFRQIIISGGSFHGLLEPAAVVDVFAALPVWIPFGVALACVCLLRLLLLFSVCGILMGIGSKCKSTAQAAAVGAVLVLVPAGVEYLFSLSFFPLSMLDAIQNLWEKPTVMLIESIVLVAAGAVGYAVAENSN